MNIKSNIKKFTALTLSIIMLLSCISVIVYAEDYSYEKNCPLININGFMVSDIYVDPDNSDELAWPPSTDKILDGVKNLLPDLAKFLVTRDWETLGNRITEEIKPCLEPAFLDKNGEKANSSGIRFTYPTEETVRNIDIVPFEYDWRLDPLETADELNKFIDYVLACTGSQKVCLTAHSLGGVIALSYMTKYGMDKIQGITMNSTAIYGETYTGELFTGDLTVTTDSLLSYLKMMYSDSDYNKLIEGTLSLIRKSGLLKCVDLLAEDIIENLYDTVAANIMLPMYVYWPTIWAMVPDEYYEESLKYVFDTMLANEDYTQLKEKVLNYTNEVRVNREKTLKAVEENCRFGVFCRYGYTGIPITKSWQNMTDATIDTKYASFGATTALYGQTLSDNEIQGVSSEYISSDKTINAATCLFPEKTWFVKNFPHASTGNDVFHELQMLILYSGKDVTVNTYEKYPRFMYYVSSTDTIVPETQVEESSIIDEIKKLLKALLDKVLSLFK